jgi:hypothetical protein
MHEIEIDTRKQWRSQEKNIAGADNTRASVAAAMPSVLAPAAVGAIPSSSMSCHTPCSVAAAASAHRPEQ